MLPRTLIHDSMARRLLFIVLATLLAITTMAVIPTGAYGAADGDGDGTIQEPEETTTTEALATQDTTPQATEDITTALPGDDAAAPPLDETTTTEAPPAQDTTPQVTEETTTTTLPTVDTTTTLPAEDAAAPLASDNRPTLSLRITVVNQFGGNSVAADWTLSASGTSGGFSQNAIFTVGGTTGETATHEVDAGVTYTLGASGPSGYHEVGLWECTVNDTDVTANATTITLTAGDFAWCKLAVVDNQSSLQLIKEVDNTGGGTADAGDWQLTAVSTGTDSTRDQDVAGNLQQGRTVFSNVGYELGEYGGPAGYTAGDWVCTGGDLVGNVVTVPTGGSVSCTITNTYDAPTTTDPAASIELGTSASATGPFTDADTAAEAASYSAGDTIYFQVALTNDGDTAFDDVIGVLKDGTSAPGQSLMSGTLDSGDTNGNGELDPAETWIWIESRAASPGLVEAEAWATNLGQMLPGLTTDKSWYYGSDEPPPEPPTLALVKTVINDNGGRSAPTFWTLTASGSSGGFSEPGQTLTEAQAIVGPYEVDAGVMYTLSEDGPAGYAASDWSCVIDNGPSIPGDTITLEAGQDASCYITNNDIAPTLTLIKKVVNDDGGTALAEEWSLGAYIPDAGGFSELATRIDDTTAIVADIPIDALTSYTMTESGPGGYEAVGTWACVTTTAYGGVVPSTERDTIFLNNGDSAECTITNDDVAPQLALEKYVTNDDGGTATADQWTLTASGSEGGLSGTGDIIYSGYARLDSTPVAAGVEYTLSESGGPQGYSAGGWSCYVGDGPSFDVDGPIMLELGEEWTCWVRNDDLPAGVDIEVSTNGDDADSPTGPVLTAGDAVAWEYVVTNTGGPSLSDVQVTDDQGVTPAYQSGDTDGDDMLDPGETWLYTANGTAALGQYSNLGTVTANAPVPQVACLDSVDGDAQLQSCSTDADTLTSDAVAPTIEVSDSDRSHYLGEEPPPPPPVEEPPAEEPPAEEPPAEEPPAEDVVVTAILTATLGDTVFNDANGNGIQDGGEAGIAGVEVVLTLPDATTQTATTDSDGSYVFTGLAPGTYTVELVMSTVQAQNGGTITVTTASSFTVLLAEGDNNLDSDFGIVEVVAAVTTAETLPNTGIDTSGIALFALLLLLAGAAAVTITHRTRKGEGDVTA